MTRPIAAHLAKAREIIEQSKTWNDNFGSVDEQAISLIAIALLEASVVFVPKRRTSPFEIGKNESHAHFDDGYNSSIDEMKNLNPSKTFMVEK